MHPLQNETTGSGYEPVVSTVSPSWSHPIPAGAQSPTGHAGRRPGTEFLLDGYLLVDEAKIYALSLAYQTGGYIYDDRKGIEKSHENERAVVVNAIRAIGR